jgi:hypothetical protein
MAETREIAWVSMVVAFTRPCGTGASQGHLHGALCAAQALLAHTAS